MKYIFTTAMVLVFASVLGCTNKTVSSVTEQQEQEITFKPGVDIEQFWMNYAESKGGLTFGRSSTYPEYEKVKEGDTILIDVEQGSCLMEFFHSRWRRANDVRRWDESVNAYGGCPYVFD